jgi:hypothetical protein
LGLSPRCKICGQEMDLADRENRRWFCSNDNINFMAKGGGWSTGDKAMSPPRTRTKSIGTALVINLFPGAGVVYAGSRIGVIYPFLTVACIFIFWPVYLYAVVVIIGSYAHTLLAVDQYNTKIRIRDLALFANAKLRVTAQENPMCPKCGLPHRPGSRYCRRCGIELPLNPVGTITNSEETRIY